MSGASPHASRQEARSQGFIRTLITLPFRIFGVLCGSFLLSILIECVGMHWFWPEEGWRHAQRMLDYELSQVSTSFTRSLLVKEPVRTTHRLIANAFDTLFVESGLLEKSREMSARAHGASDARGFKRYLGSLYEHLEAYALAACYTLLTFLVRLVVLCLTLPLFLMAVFIGLVDGLVRRDIRRFATGPESGFIYHRAKASIVPLAILPWVAYLSVPVSVHPLLILLPSALLLNLAVNLAAGSFKKYL